jgi:hypothetical protein
VNVEIVMVRENRSHWDPVQVIEDKDSLSVQQVVDVFPREQYVLHATRKCDLDLKFPSVTTETKKKTKSIDQSFNIDIFDQVESFHFHTE